MLSFHPCYRKIKILTLYLSIILVNQLYPQKSDILLDFYEQEQQTWREYVSRFQDFQPQTGFDVQFYYLDVDISITTPYIKGNVLCRFRVEENNLEKISLDLHHVFTIDSITGNIFGYQFANDLISITLDRPYLIGEIVQVRIYYQGVPELIGGVKGLRYSSHGQNEPIIATLSTPFLAHAWWPCKDGPGDKPDSVYIDITIPNTAYNGIPLIATSNEVLENVITQSTKNTFQWRERYPIVPYYVMVAISNFQTFQQQFTGPQGENFLIDYFVFNEHLSQAQIGVAQLPQAMTLFSHYFGNYPFKQEKYGMTQLGFYGAIENQTNTIQNNMSLNWFIISVHELAHMWFGDMITCLNWHHGWLNEGFATYGEALWEEYVGGFNAYKDNMLTNRYLGSGTLYLQNINDPFQIFIPIIYSKGAYVLHMLRGVLGDSLFFNSLSAYSNSSQLRYDHATTEDFQSICETVSGEDLSSFFDQWVYDENYPVYEYGYYQQDSLVTISIRQTQIQSGWREVFEMPIRLQFFFNDGSDSVVTVWNDSLFQQYDIQFRNTVINLSLDPDHWILRTAQLIDSIEPPSNGSIVRSFELYQNYPNPFNNQTKISYLLLKNVEIEIALYSPLGKKITTLYSGMQTAGHHSLIINQSELSSGVYIYQLRSGNVTESKKMVLMK
jgi:aminopeptidase N